MPPLLEARNLHKTYTAEAAPVEVLKGVEVAVESGNSLAVLGASGAGKSTLLHVLGGLDRPDQGQVWFEGEEIFSFSEQQLCEFRNRSMGFVFQFHHLLPMLTALENTSLPLRIAGAEVNAANKIAEEVLEQVGLKNRLHHRPAELSGGEQQRVAIARALVAKPKVLFADEPTGNLDTSNGEEVTELLLELQKRYQTALVVVTHNQELARRLDRQLILRDGALT